MGVSAGEAPQVDSGFPLAHWRRATVWLSLPSQKGLQLPSYTVQAGFPWPGAW